MFIFIEKEWNKKTKNKNFELIACTNAIPNVSKFKDDQTCSFDVLQGIDNLLSQIDSNYGTDKKYNAFLRRLEMVKQRQREITEEEMHTLLEERDMAMARVRGNNFVIVCLNKRI